MLERDRSLTTAWSCRTTQAARRISGEAIQFIIVDARANDHVSKAKAYAVYDGSLGYDVDKYTELTLQAAESVLWYFGYDYARLKALI